MRALLVFALALSLAACGEQAEEDMQEMVIEPPEGCPDIGALTGAEPEFPGGDFLLGIDTIFPAYEAGDKILMVDARPPFDYNLDHITGAVNVPYYDAELCAPALPKDTWIVTYCACPHQESLHVAGVLKEEGFTKVHTLDEGYIVWKERGYPITSP